MTPERLDKQIAFLREIDKAKEILRRSLLVSKSRRENDAEHSWHVAVMATLLGEYAKEPIDVSRVVKMLLVHDLVEIDAGDTFCYDTAGQAGKLDREKTAAERIFGLLPDDQARELRALWDEFEAMATPDARFAAALDRLQALLQNYHTQGSAWKKHGIRYEQVIGRNKHIADGSPRLWDFAKTLIDDAAAKGWLPGD